MKKLLFFIAIIKRGLLRPILVGCQENASLSYSFRKKKTIKSKACIALTLLFFSVLLNLHVFYEKKIVKKMFFKFGLFISLCIFAPEQ